MPTSFDSSVYSKDSMHTEFEQQVPEQKSALNCVYLIEPFVLPKDYSENNISTAIFKMCSNITSSDVGSTVYEFYLSQTHC